MRGAVKVQIGGNGIDAGFERLGGLVAGSGAEVEKRVAGFQAQEGDDGLGADVLNAAGAGVGFGLFESGAGDGGGSVGAVVLLPAMEKPFGAGKFDFARGPKGRCAFGAGTGQAARPTENGVDESGGRFFLGALD